MSGERVEAGGGSGRERTTDRDGRGAGRPGAVGDGSVGGVRCAGYAV
jgi:hypothetical protein